jgi:hypothetical protein
MRYGAQWHNFHPGPEHMTRFPIALIRETVGLPVMRTEDFHCQVPVAPDTNNFWLVRVTAGQHYESWARTRDHCNCFFACLRDKDLIHE